MKTTVLDSTGCEQLERQCSELEDTHEKNWNEIETLAIFH